jgi:trans-2,3-dihydro-3-hydroxyanthranilate isomerase
VFPDARGLSDQEMQRLAKEMNLAETTFILPRDAPIEAAEGVRVRIFTVEEELPFAGHPTLGTAWFLRQRSPDLAEIGLHLNVGRIPVRFEMRDGRLFGEMRQANPQFGMMHDHGEVAAALGIPREELDDRLPIQTVSTGLPFTIVPFRETAALSRLKIAWRPIESYLRGKGQPGFCYFVARAGEGELRARMLFYNGEDPATGSAAGCCSAWAVAHGVLASEEQGRIEQGREILRPSFIYIRAARESGKVANVRVGGHVVHVIAGTVTL